MPPAQPRVSRPNADHRRIRAELQADADAEGNLDGTIHFVDGSVVRAHPHAAGAKRGRTKSWVAVVAVAPRRSPRAEGRGRPSTFCLTGGERQEQTALPTLLESGAVKRRGRERVAGDTGSSSRTVRRFLRRRGIGAVIPRRANEPRQRTFDRKAYREHNRIERLRGRLKHNRAIAARSDTLTVSSHAMLTFACILIWWWVCRHNLEEMEQR